MGCGQNYCNNDEERTQTAQTWEYWINANIRIDKQGSPRFTILEWNLRIAPMNLIFDIFTQAKNLGEVL